MKKKPFDAPVRRKKSSRLSKRRCSVTSLVEFRAKYKRAPSDPLQVVRSSLGDDVRPLGDRSATDIQSASHMDGLFEVSDDVTLEHGHMLTMVSILKQPCESLPLLTSVSMQDEWKDCKTLGERLDWAMHKAKVSRSTMAEFCDTSTVSVGKWLNDDVNDMRMQNLFSAAKLCIVNPIWLALGEGSPMAGIPSIYADVSGPDLQLARQLTALDDKSLRVLVKQLIASKAATADAKKVKRAKTDKARQSTG